MSKHPMAKLKIPLISAKTQPFNNPFAQLGGNASAAAKPDPPPRPSSDAIDWTTQPKIIVRHERKGRAGKTVTLVQKLEAPPEALQKLAEKLRKSLGCGGQVEGQEI